MTGKTHIIWNVVEKWLEITTQYFQNKVNPETIKKFKGDLSPVIWYE